MKSSTKYIVINIIAWVVFILILLSISAYIYFTAFINLENRTAIQNSNVVYNMMITDLERLDHHGIEYANWNDTFNFVKNKNQDYIKTNYSDDFFKSNKINFAIILDLNGNVVWSTFFNLATKKFNTLSPELLNFFSKNSASFVKNNSNYHNVSNNKFGIGSFLKIKNSDDLYYFVVNTSDNK